MEVEKLHSSADQTLSPIKQIRNPKRNTQTRHFTQSRHQTDTFMPLETIIHGGLFLNPPISLSSSLPPFPNLYPFQQQRLQPPLLPLPASRTFHSLPPSTQGRSGHSLSPTIRKHCNKRKEQVTPPKKSPPSKQSNGTSRKNSNPKQDLEEAAIRKASEVVSESFVDGSTKRWGPDPENLPRMTLGDCNKEDEMKKLSGLVFSLSPPPSSLPLPKFSIRPKISCTVQATGRGVDAGATDNLCRFLRLQ
ncbi:hypothetical protein Nepgr_025639 [Nepenthes gracilis]|uniref:Uncharacterized protein n=1 Tax=Nepenthes gracilis TaxID=150966 RepID=A0AAD3T856_NEPGR|nr:hypothetical protein Nepgr_025639 [Nepenthes gracilis]